MFLKNKFCLVLPTICDIWHPWQRSFQLFWVQDVISHKTYAVGILTFHAFSWCKVLKKRHFWLVWHVWLLDHLDLASVWRLLLYWNCTNNTHTQTYTAVKWFKWYPTFSMSTVCNWNDWNMFSAMSKLDLELEAVSFPQKGSIKEK